VLQGPPCPEVRAHVVFFRGIHIPHRSCRIQARYISDSSALRCDTLNHLFENRGRSRIRTYEPLACKASALPLSYAPRPLHTATALSVPGTRSSRSDGGANPQPPPLP